jgi:hypothetical protein
MTAAEMVEHLTWAFELSTGQAEAECRVSEARRERWKAFLHDNTPTPHEFPNPALKQGPRPPRHAGLIDGAAALRAAVDRFLEQSVAVPGARHTHPLFGPLGVEEWARVLFKHSYHHLLQFGLVDEP